ncbi:MAG: hypothetical protein ACQKBY_09235 [Verrucomicrobiales bacterium]
MSEINYEIVLDLRYGGFTGAQLDKLMDDPVVSEHPVSCQFAYSPTCEGPDSWRIIVTIASPFLIVGGSFLKKLGEDLYGWFKGQVKEVFTEKSNGDGYCELHFDDVFIEVGNHPSEEGFAEIWRQLPEALQAEDLSFSKRWYVSYDEKNSKVSIHPCS